MACYASSYISATPKLYYIYRNFSTRENITADRHHHSSKAIITCRRLVNITFFPKKPCNFNRHIMPKRWRYRWLLQSNLMAHNPFYLVLLYSYSDTVHRGLLHKTLISTLLIPFCLPHNKPFISILLR